MGKASALLLFLLSFGFFVVTYNLLRLILHNRSNSDGSSPLLDPIVQMPHANSQTSPAPTFHVALTATDAPYNKWQCRIMYYWYKQKKALPGSDMGGFTRILHSGNTDNLMDEIPTFVVDPLPPGLDQVLFNSLHLVWGLSNVIESLFEGLCCVE